MTREGQRMGIMKAKILFISIPVIFLLACASSGAVRESDARDELYEVRNRIVRDRDTMEELRGLHVGRTGFFYIMDRQGTIIFHPSPSVVGISFGRYDFAREIMEKGEGVLLYGREGLRFRVYYTLLNENEILCLSIPEDEIRKP